MKEAESLACDFGISSSPVYGREFGCSKHTAGRTRAVIFAPLTSGMAVGKPSVTRLLNRIPTKKIWAKTRPKRMHDRNIWPLT